MQGGMFTVALVGQPNVGKSSMFTRLTGVGVISSNYAGTTVEFEEAVIARKENTVRVYDLPGTYGMSGNSDDEEVVLNMVKDPTIDSVVVIADETNLVSSLVLCFEVIELGLPVILALNKTDEARKRYVTDYEALGNIIGVPVVPVSAKTSEGVNNLADVICGGFQKISPFRVGYSDGIEKAVSDLERRLEESRFSRRGAAVKLMEGTESFIADVSPETAALAAEYRYGLESEEGMFPAVSIGKSRYEASEEVVKKVQTKIDAPLSRKERISEILITPSTGIPIFLAICFLLFVIMLFGGAKLDEGVMYLYDAAVGNAIPEFGFKVGGDIGEAIAKGIDGSIRAILSLVIPYIMLFYIMLGLLEDTGYLPRAVVLIDRTMHRFGLHGGAFIPMIVGLGCNVPAVMAARTIRSRRERLILTTLIVVCVPCSAQLAIIMGVVGKYSGILYAFAILLILLALMVLLGYAMNRLLKYEPSALTMELPELTVPSGKNIAYKTWERMKDFFTIAFPLLVVGSIIVEIALKYNLLDFLVEPTSFITAGMLGLPAVLIVAFIVGILRKEMAVGMLIVIAASEGFTDLTMFMTPEQFFVFGIVMAIYMPCIATIATMWKELGLKETVAVSLFSIAVAIAVGTVANQILMIV